MGKQLKSAMMLLICFVLFSVFILTIHKIPFIPVLSNAIKKNYVLLSLVLSVLFSVFSFKFLISKYSWVRILISLALFVLLFEVFVKAMFFAGYNQKIVERFGRNTYLVLTYDPIPGICVKEYSIKRKSFLFMKEIYFIGCDEYSIERLGKGQMKVLVKSPSIGSRSHYDSIFIQYEEY